MRTREKILEITFAVVFSVLIFTLFFVLLSSNGLVLGNDPAVHLARVDSFLSVGKIQLGDIAWDPPLYHVLLATFMAFTGATVVEQTMFLMKSVTALIDWLIVFSVYLLGAKFFDKKTGVLASSLMLLFFPFYEINFWGGYTSLLSLAFMFLLFLYLSLAKKDFVHNLIIFMFAFFLVLSHQLTAFLTFIILIPFVFVMFAKSKGHHSKAWIAAILGGLIAFFLYYYQIIPHFNDILILHIFYEVRLVLYQVPSTTAHAFIVNFGFTLFFAFAGIFLAFFRCREGKKMSFYLLLSLSFFVPLLLSQSYLFGLYLPYQRFIYYLLPPLAVFAAVCFSFIVNLVVTSYYNNKGGWKRLLLKIVSIIVIVLIFVLLFYHLQVVFGKISESTEYYSYGDVAGYNAGMWLGNNFPNAATAVVTEKPGSWFGVFSGKSTIAETDPASGSGRNNEAATVLDLAYEIEHPLTLVRVYESKGDISDENYVSMNDVWRRVSYFNFSEGNAYISFGEKNGTRRYFDFSSLNREIIFDEGDPKKLIIEYFNDELVITESFLVQNDSYPINIIWTLSPLRSEIDDVTLYLNDYFDLSFSFEKAYVPGLLNWENPWSKPSYAQEKNEWAIVEFSRENLTENYIGIYDEKNEVAFALKFIDWPDSGNVGVLASRQIDGVRFQYQFDKVNANQTASVTYQILTFSKSSFPEMKGLDELKDLFDFKSAPAFDVEYRSYANYIKELKIGFLVYDKNRFDSKLLGSKLLQLVYSNDEYVICEIKSVPQ